MAIMIDDTTLRHQSTDIDLDHHNDNIYTTNINVMGDYWSY